MVGSGSALTAQTASTAMHCHQVRVEKAVKPAGLRLHGWFLLSGFCKNWWLLVNLQES